MELVWTYIHTTVLLYVDMVYMHVLISWVCDFFAGTWEYWNDGLYSQNFGCATIEYIYFGYINYVFDTLIIILGVYHIYFWVYYIYMGIPSWGISYLRCIIFILGISYLIWVYKLWKLYLGQIRSIYISKNDIAGISFLWYIIFIIILGISYLIWVYKLRIWYLGQIFTTYMSNLFWGIYILVIFLGIYIAYR